MRSHSERLRRKRDCTYVRRTPAAVAGAVGMCMVVAAGFGWLCWYLLFQADAIGVILLIFCGAAGASALLRLGRIFFRLRPQPGLVGNRITIPGLFWNRRIEVEQVIRVYEDDALGIETPAGKFRIGKNFFDSEAQLRAFTEKLCSRLSPGCRVELPVPDGASALPVAGAISKPASPEGIVGECARACSAPLIRAPAGGNPRQALECWWLRITRR